MEANNTNIIELKQVDFQYQGDAAFTLNNIPLRFLKINGLQLLDIMGQENQQ